MKCAQMGAFRGGVGELVPSQKNALKPTPPQAEHDTLKPHYLMKCAQMGAFRGAWGDWSPHKKPGVGGLVPPQKNALKPTNPHTQKVPRTNHIRTHV